MNAMKFILLIMPPINFMPSQLQTILHCLLYNNGTEFCIISNFQHVLSKDNRGQWRDILGGSFSYCFQCFLFGFYFLLLLGFQQCVQSRILELHCTIAVLPGQSSLVNLNFWPWPVDHFTTPCEYYAPWWKYIWQCIWSWCKILAYWW